MSNSKGDKDLEKNTEKKKSTAEKTHHEKPPVNESAVEDMKNQASVGEASQDKSQFEEMETKYLRLAADFQNYRRRCEKERNDIHSYANEKLVTEMLDVLDNFERALCQEGNGSDGLLEGMNMIYKQFRSVLERVGLEEIEAEGKEFDPGYHNALLMEDSDAYESGIVTAVLQKGYMLNKKVIRHSLVKVAK